MCKGKEFPSNSREDFRRCEQIRYQRFFREKNLLFSHRIRLKGLIDPDLLGVRNGTPTTCKRLLIPLP